MALRTTHKEVTFSVGDVVKVKQIIQEGDKSRIQVFEGTVIGIKGREISKTFTVRRIGSQQVGIEKIFPLYSPTIEAVEVSKTGGKGVRKAKLYYIRDKSRKEINKIYSRSNKKGQTKSLVESKKTTKKAKKSVSKKSADAGKSKKS